MHMQVLPRGFLGEGAGKKGEKEGARGTTGRRTRGALLSSIFAQSILWKEASAEEREEIR